MKYKRHVKLPLTENSYVMQAKKYAFGDFFWSFVTAAKMTNKTIKQYTVDYIRYKRLLLEVLKEFTN